MTPMLNAVVIKQIVVFVIHWKFWHLLFQNKKVFTPSPSVIDIHFEDWITKENTVKFWSLKIWFLINAIPTLYILLYSRLGPEWAKRAWKVSSVGRSLMVFYVFMMHWELSEKLVLSKPITVRNANSTQFCSDLSCPRCSDVTQQPIPWRWSCLPQYFPLAAHIRRKFPY